MKLRNFFLAALVTMLAACGGNNNGLTISGLDPANFEVINDGHPVKLYVLKNAGKMEVCVTNFGARIVSVCVPNKQGNMTDVVLGFDNIIQYGLDPDSLNNDNNFGAAIGRYANRINKGQVTIAGKKYQLPQNNFGHCLHGGPEGFHNQYFDVVEVTDNSIKLAYTSVDGEMGFPGNLQTTVTYTVKDDNTLDMLFEAETDQETIVNLTNHSYFNLSGDPSVPCTDHVLFINADYYTPIDSTFMTTGEIKKVYGTPMNFTKRHPLYQTIGDTSWQDIRYANGYDHNWCLNTYKDGKGDDTKVAASVYSEATGIYMELFTDQPGLQVYTGNFLDGTVTGKNGKTYPQRASICLEPQTYPDAPNKKQFPSPYLKPGEKYHHHSAFRFSVR